METVLSSILKMKDVERFNGTRKLQGYNLLEHSYMTAMLFRIFASKEDVAYDMNVFDYVLCHDIPETITGDCVHPVKYFNKKTSDCWQTLEDEILNANPSIRRYGKIAEHLTEKQYALFKMCDILDLAIFVYREIKLGNTLPAMIKTWNKCHELFRKYSNDWEDFPHIKSFVDKELNLGKL